MPLSFADIEAALALGPMEDRSDFDLNPDARPELVSGSRARPAAVLCGLVGRGPALNVVLTRRTANLSSHAGQISFPGGKVDQGDPSPRAAALREADEEIGLTAGEVEILGRLDTYRTRTGYRIIPFVGRIAPSWRPIPAPREGAEVFEAPLDFLMDRANQVMHHHERAGARRFYHAMPWGDYYIWGATAGMLKNLSDRLDAVARERAL